MLRALEEGGYMVCTDDYVATNTRKTKDMCYVCAAPLLPQQGEVTVHASFCYLWLGGLHWHKAFC
jgi:hypothetical protein